MIFFTFIPATGLLDILMQDLDVVYYHGHLTFSHLLQNEVMNVIISDPLSHFQLFLVVSANIVRKPTF